MDNPHVEITMKQLRKNLENLNTDYTPAKRILAMTNNEILRDIQEKVNTLTFEFLKKEYSEYLDNATEEDDFKLFGCVESLVHVYYEMETCLQIIRIFEEGLCILINLVQAYHIWTEVSNSVCASWLCKEDDNNALLRIVTGWVYEYGYN